MHRKLKRGTAKGMEGKTIRNPATRKHYSQHYNTTVVISDDATLVLMLV